MNVHYSAPHSICKYTTDLRGVIDTIASKRSDIEQISTLQFIPSQSLYGAFSPSTMSLCSSSTKKSNSGRTPGNVAFRIVKYKNEKCVIATISHKKRDLHFIFDYSDYNIVSEHAWHLSSGKYIGSNFFSHDGNVKEIYLHNYLIKGAVLLEEEEKEYIVHINKNPLDNRRINLRIVNSTDHTLLKSKKKRNITLPADCGLESDDIPKHISYIKASGNHGDRFSVELPTEGIFWKTSSSKKLSLRQKLEEAKTKLEELYSIYPHLDPNIDRDLAQRLSEEYNEIIRLAELPPSPCNNA